MKKVIGIDLDDVLAETIDYILAFHDYQIWGLPIQRSDIISYHIPSIPGYETITPEIALDYFVSPMLAPDATTALKPVEGSLEKVKEFKAQGWEIQVITARSEPVRAATMAWLEYHFPGLIDGVTLCNHLNPDHPMLNKEDVAVELGAQYMIDDNYCYAKGLVEKGISTFLPDKPWNQQHDPEQDPGIIKIQHRSEIKLPQ